MSKRKLQCTNRDCEGTESPSFSVNLTVDENGQVAENPDKIAADQFTCNYCESAATTAQD
ncbi:hypothetical protein [Ferrimonas marina]|uniref:Uncharacterized protein n=1 Tax=Ferrimonas marina TaxID=299255 RepID=A0A1M5TLQ4_9GAMM|nr:hypothetical protein [Ferrimonas marina]SHH51644.1 hypothetical protein SAMN02745129_2195 [Ferrimonas marina]